MPVLPYLEHTPRLGSGVRLAGDAFVVGLVEIAGPAVLGSSAVLRGDQNGVFLGPRVVVGERTTLHVERELAARVGGDVWLGSGAVVHACALGDGVRVEDGGLVLSGSTVGAGSIVAAGSLVPEGATFPEHSYISGTPGRRQRDTTPEERAETLARIQRAVEAAAG